MNKTSLLKALQTAKPSLGAEGGVIPVLPHFCFMGDILYAYNDVHATIVEEATGLTCALHGDTLVGLLSVIRDEDIDIKLHDNYAQIKAQTGMVRVPLLSEKEFLFTLPEEEPQFSLPITPETVKGLELCLGSVGTDSIRPEFAGITLRAGKGGEVVVFSSNNLSASRYVLGKFIGRKGGAVVLPAASCEQILRLVAGVIPPPKLSVSERVAVVEGVPKVTFVTKVFTAKPDQFDSVFVTHTGNAKFIQTPPGLDIEMQKASILLGKEQTKECVIAFARGFVEITAAGQLGKMQTRIKYDGTETGSVKVGPALVLGALPHTQTVAVNHDRSLVFAGGNFTRIISSAPTQVATAPPKPTPPDDDIPY